MKSIGKLVKSIEIKKVLHYTHMYARGYRQGLSAYGVNDERSPEDHFNMPGSMRRGMHDNCTWVWYKHRFFFGKLIKKKILY